MKFLIALMLFSATAHADNDIDVLVDCGTLGRGKVILRLPDGRVGSVLVECKRPGLET